MNETKKKPLLTGRFRKPSEGILRTLGDNVRARRRELNLSQEELAEKCELHRTYVGSVERGERNVTLSTLETLATALNCNLAELIR